MTAFTEEWVFSGDGVRLYTRRYLPSDATTGSGKWGASKAKAAILFVHGFIEHIARCVFLWTYQTIRLMQFTRVRRYEHVFPLYAAKGIAVLSFDQRGFGRSALDTENRCVHSGHH